MVVIVLPLADVQEIVEPVTGLCSFIRIVHDGHDVTVLPVGIVNQASLVQSVDVDALLAFDFESGRRCGNLQESIFVFGFEQSDGVDRFAVQRAIGEIDHVEFSPFDFGVVALFVEVLGELDGLFMQGLRIVENAGDEIVCFVQFQ